MSSCFLLLAVFFSPQFEAVDLIFVLANLKKLLPNVDFVAFAVLAVVLAIQNELGLSATEIQGNSLCMPDWFEARLGTDEVLDAFRQLPVFPAYRPLNTVARYDTRACAYRLQM